MSRAQQLHHRRFLDDSRQIINRRGLPSTVQGDVCQQGQATVLAPVQSAIAQAREEELSTVIGCKRSACTPPLGTSPCLEP